MSLGSSITAVNEIAPQVAERIFDSLIQGAILAALAALLLTAFRRYGSRMRFVVWFSVLLALVADPLLGLICPHGMSEIRSKWLPMETVSLPSSWGTYFFGLWAAIAGLALARVAVGMWRLRRLRRSCVPLDPDRLPADVQETFAHFQPWRKVRLCTSDALETPTAIGFWPPVIVIPASLLDELSSEDLRHVVLHELAHIRRWDDWSNLAQKLVKSLLFFHPVVWWVERRISLEREMACDETVVATTANPRAYAQCLALLAERSFTRRTLELVHAVVGRVRQTTTRVITTRVMKILAGTPLPPGTVWKAALPTVVIFFVVSTSIVARIPDLVMFSTPGGAVPAADSEIAGAPVATPLAVRTPEGAARTLTTASAVRPVLAANASQSAAARAPSRVPRAGKLLTAKGDVILVIFEERQSRLAGTSDWQIRVWEVTLICQLHNAGDARAL